MTVKPQVCRIDFNSGRLRLESRPGLTLYAACRMEKKYMATGCGARGACGLCRVRVLSGVAGDVTDNEKAKLTPEEIEQGYRLGCQLRLVAGDLAVEAPDSLFTAQEFHAKVECIDHLTYDTRHFRFALTQGKIKHRAGQYVAFSSQPYGEVKTKTLRAYSLANASVAGDRIDLTVRRVPNGMCTTYMFDHMKVGDDATLYGPYGDFYLRDTEAPAIWIAGGSGLSPFMGMLQDLEAKGNVKRQVTLFFGAVTPKDLYYVKEMREAMTRNPWFSYVPALSGNEKIPECSEYGLITEVVARRIAEAAECEAYLCGSPGMIGACLKTLTEKGVRADRIYFDKFG